jgi:hypothetical protein
VPGRLAFDGSVHPLLWRAAIFLLASINIDLLTEVLVRPHWLRYNRDTLLNRAGTVYRRAPLAATSQTVSTLPARTP